MKLFPQIKQFSICILLIVFSYISVAQTRLIVTGAKVNMANAVYLSTNNISVSDNSLVSVAGSTIKIAGSTTSLNAIDANNGTVNLFGTNAQQLSAGSFLAKTVKAVTINNIAGAAISDTLSLTDVLTVSSGSLTTGGYLTLKSTAEGTARIAPVTSLAGTPIDGNVIVERFIPAKRAFRFLTAPVNTAGSMRDNWMEGVNNLNTASGNINPVPNFGSHITGSGGNTSGFDPTYTNNPSLFIYNNATQTWVAATNTGTKLTAGSAFRILVRGSRSTNLNSNTPPPSPTTLRAKGTVVTGTIVLKAAGAGGTPDMPELSTADSDYSFIANPYASPVNWLSVDLKDIASTMYIFDPTITGMNGRGGYIAFNRSIGPSGINSNDTSKIDNNIQSGQAFLVQTTGPSPSLTFKETYKTGINRPVFRTPNNIAKLSLQLLLPSQVINGGAADGLTACFSDQFSSSIGDEDSYKFTNQDENIAILRNGKVLSIEGRKPVTASDTIPLKMWQLTLKNYVLKVAMKNFTENAEGYLEDAYMHTSTRLSKDTATMLPFTITEDSLSLVPERFKIVFKSSVSLPVELTVMKAHAKNKGVEVEWTMKSETNIERYVVEKSANAQQFLQAGAVQPKVSFSMSSAYTWFDPIPFDGDNYYRIKFLDYSGEAKYSNTAKVNFKTTEGIFVVTNNSNSLIIAFKYIKKGKYSLSLINNAGQKVYSSSIDHAGGSVNQVIKLKNLLSSGVYHLQVSGDVTLKNIPVLIP